MVVTQGPWEIRNFLTSLGFPFLPGSQEFVGPIPGDLRRRLFLNPLLRVYWLTGFPNGPFLKAWAPRKGLGPKGLKAFGYFSTKFSPFPKRLGNLKKNPKWPPWFPIVSKGPFNQFPLFSFIFLHRDCLFRGFNHLRLHLLVF